MMVRMKPARTSTFRRLAQRIIARYRLQAPGFVVGSAEEPYLLRWYVIPRNPLFNIYVHLFLRSDDDRALHDHSYSNLSVLLQNTYTEHTLDRHGAPATHVRREGDMVFRPLGGTPHRISLHNGPCWTLFITGPRYREWGFHCPKGWIPWYEFTEPGAPGHVGPGCGS